MKQLLRLALAATLLTACTPGQYTARTLNAPALAAHRTVAILPFEVLQDRIRLRDIRYVGSDTSRATQRRVQQEWSATQQREAESVAYQLQALLQTELQVRRPPLGYTVQFQDVQETNLRLKQAGITYATLPERSMSELQRVLGVDGLLSGQTELYQPLPAGLGLAARVLLNEPLTGPGATAVVPASYSTTNLTVHDCQSGQLTWRFDFVRTGQAALEPNRLAPALVKASAASFPYRRR